MQFRNSFHLHPLSSAELFVPCGGRPEAVNASNVESLFFRKENGELGKPRFQYIVEGANLFFTQEARLFLEKNGVIIIKDASANKVIEGGTKFAQMGETERQVCYSQY